MIRRKSTEVLAIVLVLVMLVVSCLMPCFAEAAGGIEQQYESTLFGTNLITVDIQMDADDWQDMLDNALSETYYAADVTINGQTFENVGIRPKGNTSLTQVASSDSDCYSFKIEFDHYQDGQTCWGLDKLVLNNLMSDATYLKEYFVYDMFAFLDMPASDYAMAEITVNGEPWGIYLALEGVEESFLTRNFGASPGELYKPENMGGGGPGGMMDKDEDEIREMMGLSEDEELPEMPEMGEMPQMGEMPEPPDGAQMPGQPPMASTDDTQDTGDTQPAQDTQSTDTQNDQTATDSQPSDPSDSTQTAPADDQTREGFQHGGGRGGMGGGMSSGGSDLNYIDDDLDSYETIWEGEVTDTDDADHQRVVEALKKISEGDLSGVDVDLLCKYMAVQTFVINLDSLSGNMAHNYYLYEKDGQLALLPWDYNLAFGGFMSGDASSTINFPIDTPVSSVSVDDRQIFAVILNDEDACALYHSYLEKLCTEYVQGGQFELTYTMLRGLLDSRVATEEHDPTAFYTADEYTEAVEMLKTVIERRAESILGQLDGTIPSTTDGQQADSSTLVDASDLDLSVMGSQFGGGGHGGNGAEGGMMGRGGKMMPGAAGQQSEDTFAAPDDASQPSADTATDTTQTTAAQSAQPPEASGEKPSGTPPDGQTPPGMASESNLSTTS